GAGIVVAVAQVEVVKIGNRRGDAQAQPATGNAVTARCPVKPLEYLIPFAGLDPTSAVAYPDQRTALLHRGGYIHRAVLGCELDRVFYQVRYGLANQITVSENLHGRLNLKRHLDRLRRRERLEELEQIAANGGQVDGPELARFRTIFDFGKSQQRRDRHHRPIDVG